MEKVQLAGQGAVYVHTTYMIHVTTTTRMYMSRRIVVSWLDFLQCGGGRGFWTKRRKKRIQFGTIGPKLVHH